MAVDKNDILCTGCRKKIADGILNDGRISIKCKCGTINTIEATPKETSVSKVILNGHHSGLTLGTFSIQHISEDIAR
jgi:hypothetical protein